MGKPTAIDIYAGAGGSTTGLALGGCDVRLAVECDSDAADTYAANHPDVELLPDLIESYTPTDLRERAGLGSEQLTIFSACPPCQGYSTLGNCDTDDERNDHVLGLGPLVEELGPQAVIIENVPGLEKDSRCTALTTYLSGLGYGVNSWVIDASDLCVPQRRRRYVLLAIEGLEDSDITDPRQTYTCDPTDEHPHSVQDVLAAVGATDKGDDLHTARQLPKEILRRVRAIPHDGGSRWALPDDLQLACHKRLDNRNAGSVYGRMSWKEKAPTMTTRCTTPACGRFLHPEDDRPITLREAAAFQTFPPDYVWKGGKMSIARQIGNAVPVRLGYVLTLHALELTRLATERRVSA